MSSADKLIIETPEQTSIEFPLAGIGSRFLALAIDLLLRFAFILVLVGIGGILGLIGMIKAAGTQWVVAALIVAYFFMDVGYFAFFESVWNGQTPGKRWTHLRVIKDSGRPIGVPDAVLRNLMRTVDYLPSLYAAGVVSILISRQNKRLGDLVAGTVVVRENPLQGLASVWESSSSVPGDGDRPFSATQRGRITIDRNLPGAPRKPGFRRASRHGPPDRRPHRGVPVNSSRVPRRFRKIPRGASRTASPVSAIPVAAIPAWCQAGRAAPPAP